MALTGIADRTVKEGKTLLYTTTLLDETSTAIASASIDALTLTLYDVDSGTIINSRTAQDVLNTNQVTIHATSGLLSWTSLPADNPIVNTPGVGELEHHVALFEMTYDTTKALNWEVAIYVEQMTHVP